jgi:uncharacterized protein YecE (DUF72 family)
LRLCDPVPVWQHEIVIFAGTSGWAYASWKPDFYPAKTASNKFLQHYATRLNSAELNYTFRRFPSQKLLAGWIEATPPGFRFSVKAHQNITHVKRLRDASEFTRSFLSSLEPLAQSGKLGAILFQLPPFQKVDAALLEAFLALLPKGFRYTFEFRHESWFSDAIYDLLRRFNAALCVAESDTLETPGRATADFSYFRLRKSDYSPEERSRIGCRLAEMGHDSYVYFKHEETPAGALYAEELLQAAGRR